jgi:SAM-dependent methyltransferase
LGFGQGMSVNIHAAASVIEWHGTDFNPSQAGFAQELAAISGSGAKLYDDAFSNFANRSDLPDFDYIGIHGIWSWISDDNRAVIVDFVRRKLKVGGVLYISYNTLPGWAAFAPMRHLMTQHAEIMGSEGLGIIHRIDGALEFTEKLLATNPIYARANPQVVDRIKKIKEQNRSYLAHEYFNRDWHPMHFASMAEWLSPAKLNYACSAHHLDHIDAINFTAEQQALLKSISDPMFRESSRDFIINQQFRRDYWVKGLRRLTPLERSEALRELKGIMVSQRQDISLKVTTSIGEITMSEAIYNPILDQLAHHNAKSLSQIEQSLQDKGVSLAQIVEAIMLLTGSGHLTIVQDDNNRMKAKKHTDKLNGHLMHKACGSNDIGYLASPVSGGGMSVGRFQLLFLLALSKGKKQPNEWAQFAWQILSAQGQKIVKEGKVLETADENLSELTTQATTFAEKQLPILKALNIV